MAQSPQLSATMVEKGRARPAEPSEAVGQARAPAAPVEVTLTAAPSVAAPAPTLTLADPPLEPAPLKAEATKQMSFRASTFLQAEMRDMIYATGRTQQDIMTEFLTEGFYRWRVERKARQAG